MLFSLNNECDNKTPEADDLDIEKDEKVVEIDVDITYKAESDEHDTLVNVVNHLSKPCQSL
jgi:hypothetical protein